jgi:hypothetical protein
MATKLNEGRWTAEVDGEVVVFLIGMRFNKLRAVNKWWPMFAAMPRMLRELQTNPDSGLLSYHLSFGWRSITLVQYWRSVDELTSYANDAKQHHRPSWLDYYRNAFKGGAVGFWHETYRARPGTHEQIYLNMPTYGLAAASKVVQVGSSTNTARERLAAHI